MPIPLTWTEIAIRLLSAIVSGALIGLNRGEHGRAAGLRTSILVCLAACIAMIQVNLLLPLAGRMPDSFVMNDLMRLPLGILSGMGFIGAGSILRRGNFVFGVTTAATMWVLTVIGLCLGGGQILLGLAGTGIVLAVLTGFKVLEDRMTQEHLGRMIVSVTTQPESLDHEIRAILESDGFEISSCGVVLSPAAAERELTLQLRWRDRFKEVRIPDSVHRLAAQEGVIRVTWIPRDR